MPIQANEPWFGTPFFEPRLDGLDCSEADRKLVRDFATRGYLVIPDLVSQTEADQIVTETLPTFDNSTPDGPRSRIRVQDIWQDPSCRSVRALASHPEVLRILRLLYQRRPIPFQTLNFQYGTEQAGHRDSMFFDSLPQGYMCGVWVALEDVSPDNGSVFYYPGSHLTPRYSFDELGLGPRNTALQSGFDHDGAREEYEDFLLDVLAQEGLGKEDLVAKKGTVLIWAAGLVHGGGAIGDRSRTRLSQVTHYFFEDCLYVTPYYCNEWCGDLYLREVRDVSTGDAVSNRYGGMDVQGVDCNDVYRLVLDEDNGISGVKAVKTSHMGTSETDRIIQTLETNVRDYKTIIEQLQTSPAFRVGRAMTSPLRLLRGLIDGKQ